MLRAAAAAFGCAVVTVTHAQAPSPLPWPGSLSLSYGYNILRGDPASAGADPGWSTQPVFDVNCASCFAGGSIFQGWSLPAGVAAAQASQCSYNSSVFTVHDAASWQTALSSLTQTDTDIDLILADLQFTGAQSSASVSTTTLAGGAVVTLATAECDVFSVAIDPSAYTYALTDNFLAGLNALPPLDPLNATIIDMYASFTNTFGTHVPESLSLGGFAAQSTLFTGASFTAMQSSVSSVSTVASAALFIFFGVAADAGASWSLSEYVTFAASSSSNTTVCKPACPPSAPDVDVNPLQWTNFLGFNATGLGVSAPVPVRSTLVPLPIVLTRSALPRAHARGLLSDAQAATALRAAADLLTFLNSSYCGVTPGCGTPSSVPVEVSAPFQALPVPVCGASTAYVTSGAQSAVLVMGGSSACATPPVPTNGVFVTDASDPSAGWITKATAPIAFSHAATLTLNSAVNGSAGASPVFIAGGFTATAGVVSNATYTYTVDNGVWMFGDVMVSPRAGAVAAEFAGVAVLAGGFDGTNVLTSIECFTLAMPGRKEACPSAVPTALPAAAAGAAALVIPSPLTPGADMLIVFGGCGAAPLFGGDCASPLTAVWFTESMGPRAGAWSSFAPLPVPLYAHTSLYQPPNAAAGVPMGAVWAIGGSTSAAAAPAAGVYRLLLHAGVWATLPWSDSWPTAYASAVSIPGQPGVLEAQALRIGGCAQAGTAFQVTDMLTAFRGGLQTGASQ